MAPRLAIYGLTSTAFATAVISSALHSRANFFAAAVAVGRSSGSLMVRHPQKSLLIEEPLKSFCRYWRTLRCSMPSVWGLHSRRSSLASSALSNMR